MDSDAWEHDYSLKETLVELACNGFENKVTEASETTRNYSEESSCAGNLNIFIDSESLKVSDGKLDSCQDWSAVIKQIESQVKSVYPICNSQGGTPLTVGESQYECLPIATLYLLRKLAKSRELGERVETVTSNNNVEIQTKLDEQSDSTSAVIPTLSTDLANLQGDQYESTKEYLTTENCETDAINKQSCLDSDVYESEDDSEYDDNTASGYDSESSDNSYDDERMYEGNSAERTFPSDANITGMASPKISVRNKVAVDGGQISNLRAEAIKASDQGGAVLKPFVCEDCGASFKQIQGLESHMLRVHSTDNPYECEACGVLFNTERNLGKHLLTHDVLKRYKCDECSLTFKFLTQLNRHKRRHTGVKPFKCDLCGDTFGYVTSLAAHKLIHTGEKPFTCDECGAKFREKRKLKAHMRRHTGVRPFMCEECGKTFAESSDLINHRRSHTKPYSCNYCEAKFSNKSSCEVHISTRHTGGEKPFKCTECDATFGWRSSLNTHRVQHHGHILFKCDKCGTGFRWKSHLKAHVCGEKSAVSGTSAEVDNEDGFKCEKCGATFAHSGNLIRHFNTFHTEGRTTTCDYCGLTYTNNACLKQHVRRIHTNEKPFKCEYCTACFVDRGGLNKHRRRHTGEKPYKCPVCEKSFSDLSTFKRHKTIHSTDKMFKCSECGVSYKRQDMLRIHKRVHTGEKPYKCEFCDAMFSSGAVLIRHRRIHTGQKIYECDQCGEKFKLKSQLQSHAEVHTEEINTEEFIMDSVSF